MAATPQNGDVIVRRRVAEASRTSLRFDVAILDHPSQFTEVTYEQALNTADRFARIAGVNVWYTEDGKLFRAITQRRQPTSV
jgi:hypothetical protein